MVIISGVPIFRIFTVYCGVHVFGKSICDGYSISVVHILMKYCPFTPIYGACSLSSLIFKEKKIPLVFQTYEYMYSKR